MTSFSIVYLKMAWVEFCKALNHSASLPLPFSLQYIFIAEVRSGAKHAWFETIWYHVIQNITVYHTAPMSSFKYKASRKEKFLSTGAYELPSGASSYFHDAYLKSILCRKKLIMVLPKP